MIFSRFSLVTVLTLALVAPLTSTSFDKAPLIESFVRELAEEELCLLQVHVGAKEVLGSVQPVRASKPVSSASATPDTNSSTGKESASNSASATLDANSSTGEEYVSELIGLSPAPTLEDIEYLTKQASDAEKRLKLLQAGGNQTAGVPEKCAECAKYFQLSTSKDLIPEAKKVLLLAATRLKKAQHWAMSEAKRESVLPSLVKTLQDQAHHEHLLRKAAEKEVEEKAKAQSDAERQQSEKLGPLRQAIVRQRFADRIRAAEDARVASIAVKEAHAAHIKAQKQGFLDQEKALAGANSTQNPVQNVTR